MEKSVHLDQRRPIIKRTCEPVWLRPMIVLMHNEASDNVQQIDSIIEPLTNGIKPSTVGWTDLDSGSIPILAFCVNLPA